MTTTTDSGTTTDVKSLGTLTPTTVFLFKGRKVTHNRKGLEDKDGQVFVQPKSEKRVEHWKQSLREKGYEIA